MRPDKDIRWSSMRKDLFCRCWEVGVWVGTWPEISLNWLLSQA